MDPTLEFLEELEVAGNDPYMMGEAAIRELKRHGLFPTDSEAQTNLAIRIGVCASEHRVEERSHESFAYEIFNV